jgi:hypothetical protein
VLRQQYRDDLFLLRSLCGVTDTALIFLQAPSLVMHADTSVFRSPLFLKYRIDSLSILSRKSLVDLNYKTRLNAFGDAGINAVELKNLEQRVGFSVGLSLAVPIYDGKQRQLDYRKLDLAEKSRKNYADFFSDQVRVRLYQLEADRKSNESLSRKISEEQQDVETLLSMNRLELEHGSISVTDYILNLRRYLDLQQQLSDARVRSYFLINEYNYLAW